MPQTLPARPRSAASVLACIVIAGLIVQIPAVTSAAPPENAPANGFRRATQQEIDRAGLRPGTGVCDGRLDGTNGADKLCTHGPDVVEYGATTEAVAATSPVPSNGQIGTSIPCYSTGPYVKVLYIYGSTNFLDYSYPHTRRPLIREAVALADRLFYNAAKNTSGYRRVRWRMSSTCKLSITAVKMSPSTNIYTMRNNLINSGKLSKSEKGLAFLEGSTGCNGLAELAPYTTSSSSNPNNYGGMLAQVNVFGCLKTNTTVVNGGSIAAHELLHTLGAVQDGAPYSTNAGHCRDESDVMCYADGGRGPQISRCTKTAPERLDCGYDTYFDVTPSSSEWLATHWNTAKNRFLARGSTSNLDVLARPTVTLTAPVNGAVVGGNMTMTANPVAPSGSGIPRVQFLVDGALRVEDKSPPYSVSIPTMWDGFQGYKNGAMPKIQAYVIDGFNRVGKSAIATVTVGNPTVRLTTPTTDQGVGQSMSWTADAAAYPGRTVSKVEVLVNGVIVGSPDFTAPYTGTAPIPGFDPEFGPITVSARVTDSGGAFVTSTARQVVPVGPSVELIGLPSSWLTVSDDMLIVAEASPGPGGSVTSVTFRVDGIQVGSADTTAPYSVVWNASAAAAGSHTVTATVLDSNGTTVTTDEDYVSSEPTSDVVTLTAPASPTSTATLTASVTLADPTAVVDSVQFYDGGTSIGADYDGAPYTFDWDPATAAPGRHVLRAVANVSQQEEPWGYWSSSSTGSLSTTTGTASVSFATPAIGATVLGAASSASVSASLPTGHSVGSVEYFVNERLVGSDYDIPATIAWDTTSFADGAYTLRAVATIYTPSFDSYTVETTRSITIANFRILLTEPDAGDTVTGTFTLTASVVPDPEAVVDRVRFYVAGLHVGTDTTTPYTYAWNSSTASNGLKDFAATVWTTDGRSVTATHQATVGN